MWHIYFFFISILIGIHSGKWSDLFSGFKTITGSLTLNRIEFNDGNEISEETININGENYRVIARRYVKEYHSVYSLFFNIAIIDHREKGPYFPNIIHFEYYGVSPKRKTLRIFDEILKPNEDNDEMISKDNHWDGHYGIKNILSSYGINDVQLEYRVKYNFNRFNLRQWFN